MRILILVALLALVGCNATTKAHRGMTPQECRNVNGVMFKGPHDLRYRCVDRDQVRRAMGL